LSYHVFTSLSNHLGLNNRLDTDKMAETTSEQPSHETVKLVLNVKYGGFGLSEPARQALSDLLSAAGKPVPKYVSLWHSAVNRATPELVQVVEKMGSEAASGECAKLEVKSIPKDLLPYAQIKEYDGTEWIGYAWVDVLRDVLTKLTPDNAQQVKQDAQRLLALANELEG
jgi:hypothetical protein